MTGRNSTALETATLAEVRHAVVCRTCRGLGILVARHRHEWHWAPCPPWCGRGHDRADSERWDAGCPSEWGRASTPDELAEIARVIRGQAPAKGSVL